MEFDKNMQQPVSDEERRLAETKKLTLEPVHADVVPEAVSDSAIASRHLIEPAIANVANDTEQDASHVQPSKGFLQDEASNTKKHRSQVVPVIAVLGVGVVIAVALFFFLTR
jgi:hypothetical protein